MTNRNGLSKPLFLLVSLAIELLLAPPTIHAQSLDLTGFWRTDTAPGSLYLQYRVRQIGSDVYWVMDSLPLVMNVFQGTLSGDTLKGNWVDVPGGQIQNAGVLTLRVESNDRMVKIGESIPYGAFIWYRQGIRTQKSIYAPFEPPVVEFSGFPGNLQDWITIVPATAADTSEGQYYYTGGKLTGSFTYDGLASGVYEARAYFDSPAGGRIVRDRFRFVVSDTASGLVLRTQKPVYAPKEPVVVEYIGFPGNSGDWITVVPASNAADQYAQDFYTGGKRGGFFVFTGPDKPGAYEARAYFDWPAGGYTIQARAPFTVGEPGTSGGTGSGICDDPRSLAIMDEWLARAIPPQQIGETLRYEAWGRLVGRSLTATITVNGPPDTPLSRCEYLWERADQLRSTNGLGTLKEYVEKRRLGP